MKQRNYKLDLLRFFAANLVVLQHLAFIEWGDSAVFGRFRSIADLGYLGVDVFFALSGFVIARSAINRNATDFLISRFLRIFPGLIFAGVLSAICVQVSVAPVHTNFFGDISTIFLLNDPTRTQSSNPVFWTLVYEFKFYIAIALLLVAKKNQAQHLRVFALVWLFSSFFLGPNGGGVLGGLLIPNFAACFVFGIILSAIKTKRELVRVLPFLFISMILILNTRIQEWLSFDSDRQHRNSQWEIAASLLILFSLFTYCALSSKTGGRFQRLSYKLGAYSYPIYLLHFTPMITFLAGFYKITHNAYVSLAVSYLGMLAVSIIFVEWIEPRMKRSFKKLLVDEAG